MRLAEYNRISSEGLPDNFRVGLMILANHFIRILIIYSRDSELMLNFW